MAKARKPTRTDTYSAHRPRRIGRLHPSKNALKHGLCVRLGGDPRLQKQALNIAYAIVGRDAEEAIVEQALIVAESELELVRSRQIGLAMIETAIATKKNTCDASPGAPDSLTTIKTETADAFLRALADLRVIERYQRRFYSRKKKALQILQAMQSMRASGLPIT